MRFDLISAPLILGSASLVAFVSVRSTSIAGLLREIDREVIAPATTQARRRNLVERQMRPLKRRYQSDTVALVCLLLSFVAFVTMGAFAGGAETTGAAALALGAGMLLGLVGFALVLFEVATSPHTLFADTAFAEEVYEGLHAGSHPTEAIPGSTP